jgi:type IV pilus assembly protein PilY1
MNRNSFRTERQPARAPSPRTQWWAAPCAFLATLLALPVNAAVIIPSDPLASGVRVAPNILFILDDSGSMAWENINNTSIPKITDSGTDFDGPGTNGVGNGYENDLSEKAGASWMYEQNYITNSLYYDPSVDYEPWMGADGNRLTGGTSYTSAYSSTNYVTYVGVENNTSGGSVDLSNRTRTYYVPKDTARTDSAYLSEVGNYYRYQIMAGGAQIMRSEYSGMGGVAVSPSSGSVSGSTAKNHTLASVSAGAELSINISSSNRTVLYRVFDPSGIEVCDSSVNEDETETCFIPSTVSGVYKVTTRRWNNTNNNANYSLNASYVEWTNATAATPGRLLADEKANFATWYSYFRTRIKAAKGGAADAFNPLGNKVRVGYRSLHQNGSNNFDIPVTDGNDGRFVNNDGTNGKSTTTSRSKWFNRLFRASANSGTPLQSALNSAGQYFSGTGASGPYGPESSAAQLSCRQNFTILTTDGYWNGGTVSTGTSGDGGNGGVITNGPAAADGGVATTDINYKKYQYKQPAPYKDSNSNTLADVAMKYWKTDLRADLANNVPSGWSKVAGENDQIDRDPAFWQHMVTFAISIGLRAKSGMSSVSDVTTATTWAAPGDDDVDNIDDLLHAAVNSRGTFVSASSPKAFSDGLTAALAKIDERTASFSNVGASDSTQLNTGTRIFTGSYVAGRWSGLLRAEGAVSGLEVWNTNNSGTFSSYSSRKIYTRSGSLTGGVGSNGVGGGASFPTTAQSGALARSGGPANYEVTASDNANYIKGQQTKEGTGSGQLRPRTTVMGDVVNSSPAYVADSDTVFIGANDGMLHAFDASNGEELFAYVPNIINFGNLADLSRGDYEHHWFVDGPIAISPLALGPGGNKNILVGALGRGGRGLYALDVTAPSSFASSNVKWERSSTSATAANDNMGMVLGAPVLAKVRTGTTTTKPAVVLGNGINSRSGKAALLVLDMDNGSVIREIATDDTLDNGLSAPTGIYAADGKTLVYAYAGDRQGNVWKFDLTSTNPSSWSARKIFHAEKTAGTPQPITGGIASARDPRTNKRWVFFGTGSYLTTADGNDAGASTQSMYGIIDDVGATDSAHTRAALTARSVTVASDGSGERYFQKLTGTMMSGKHGWYVDLTDPGERIVQNAQMDGSYLVTASMMPSGNSCSDANGSGYINGITPFPDMSAGDRSYFDRDGLGTDNTGTDGNPTGSVRTDGMPTLPLLLPGELRYQTSKGTGETLGKGKPQWNRVSWRELRND